MCSRVRMCAYVCVFVFVCVCVCVHIQETLYHHGFPHTRQKYQTTVILINTLCPSNSNRSDFAPSQLACNARAHIHTHIHTRTSTCTHTNMHRHMHTHTHTHTHINTRTHKHTHTHIQTLTGVSRGFGLRSEHPTHSVCTCTNKKEHVHTHTTGEIYRRPCRGHLKSILQSKIITRPATPHIYSQWCLLTLTVHFAQNA